MRPKYLERILDANFNRAREGIRVLEEVARFLLDDPALTGRFKHVRHRLRAWQESVPGAPGRLLAARDPAGDVGLDLPAGDETRRENCLDLLTANFKRVQEALRVLEEYTKFLGPPGEFKQLRFELYELEKAMLTDPRLAAWPGLKKEIDYSVCVITGAEAAPCRRPAGEVAAAAIAGGATVIQLREKDCPARRLIEVGRELRHLTREKGAALIVNDRADVALAVDADGVHLGQDDLPLTVARQILGPEKIIGISTHSLEEALAAQAQGADYIGVGPVFATATKKTAAAPVGLDLLRRLKGKITVPKVAIGGITAASAGEVIRAGADGVAVISAVADAPDAQAAALALSEAVRRA